jgi:hypothetical protein
MNKKVQFNARPPSSFRLESSPVVSDATAIDAWVNNKPAVAEAVKRFTFEVPVSLHKRIKMQCAAQERQMADVLRELLEKHFPEV